MKLLVNVCGHPLCDKCIELMFATGSAKCYQCPTPLKRGNFKRQLFQDSQVEKDIQVRRDILRKFSRGQDTFPNLRAYNDYLEKLETVIYNLANDIDLDDTNRMLEELRRPTSDVEKVKPKVQIKEKPYHHKLEKIECEGPHIPELDERFIRAIRSISTREVAGGFTAQLAISRALGDAFGSLFSRHCKNNL